jgi:hypothetical protein
VSTEHDADERHYSARQVLKSAREYLAAEADQADWNEYRPRGSSADAHDRVAAAKAERTRMAVDQFELVLGRYVDARVAEALREFARELRLAEATR